MIHYLRSYIREMGYQAVIGGVDSFQVATKAGLGRLDSSGRFGEVTVTNMSRSDDEGMDFTLLGSLDKQGTGVSGIEVALNSLPTTISLTNVSSTNGTLGINGRSPDEDEILSYLQDLEASGKFSEITITSMSRIEDEGMDFSLVLEVGE